jgi:hypothetical protein
MLITWEGAQLHYIFSQMVAACNDDISPFQREHLIFSVFYLVMTMAVVGCGKCHLKIVQISSFPCILGGFGLHVVVTKLHLRHVCLRTALLELVKKSHSYSAVELGSVGGAWHLRDLFFWWRW